MSASPEQLHELLMYCIGFARTMLEETGTFYPFGAVLAADGKVGGVGGHTGAERPKPQDVYRLLSGGFVSGARSGQYLGTALAANVNIPQHYSPVFPDGLRVHLESAGYARFIYVPYRLGKKSLLSRKKRVVQLGEPFSVEVPPSVFVGSGTS
jgi:hypothetical protein